YPRPAYALFPLRELRPEESMLTGGFTRRIDVRMVMVRALSRLAAIPALVAATFALALSAPAGAAQPQPWEITLQPAATPIMEMIHRFNDGLMIVVTVITAFVLGL